jgi:hypothetical protein
MPRCNVDLGPAPKVHLLELVREDESGRRIERVVRWVNLPGAAEAEVQTQTTCPPAADACSVTIGWAHPDHAAPSRIRVALDGRPVDVPKSRTLEVAAKSARSTLLTVDLVFPDNRRAFYAGAIGGRTRDESTAVSAMLHERACMPEEAKTIARRYEFAGIPLRTLEPGAPREWDVTFVAEPSILPVLQRWFRPPHPRGHLPVRPVLEVPDAIDGVFGKAGSIDALTLVVADPVRPEADLLQRGTPEFWVERLVAGLEREKAGRLSASDAVAAAGYRAAAEPRRRSVVLLLGDVDEDASTLPAGGVREYLKEIRVPFEAWRVGAGPRADWPGARPLAGPTDLLEVLLGLRLRGSCQAIAWVAAEFRTASRAAN